MARKPEELRQLAFLAGLDLPARQLAPALMALVERMVPCTFANLFWMDEIGRATDAWIAEVIPAAMDAFVGGQEELRADPREPTLDKYLRDLPPGRAPSLFDHAGLRDTRVFNEVFRPYGIGGPGMAMALRNARGRPMVIVFLNREPGSTPFTPREQRLFHLAHDPLARALRLDEADRDWTGEHIDSTGYLVLDRRGRTSLATGDATRLLAQFCSLSFAEGTRHLDLLENPPAALSRLVERAAGQAPGLGGAFAAAERDTPWGRIAIRIQPEARTGHAPGGDGGRFVAALERRIPREAAVARRLGDLDLTPRERELSYFIGLGLPFDRIGQTMDLSTATLRSYAKSIYAKLGVEGRGALEARLRGGAVAAPAQMPAYQA